MFGLFTMGRMLAIASIVLVLVNAVGYYEYQLHTRDNNIDELKTKALVQGVEIDNLNTSATVQKNINKNKVFEEVQKSKKKDIQNVQSVSKTNVGSDIDVTAGKHSITL